MSETKRDPVNEQESDDDLLAGVSDALRPADEGAKAAGETIEEEPDEDQAEDNNDGEEDSDSDTSDSEEETDDDESKEKYFKLEIGRQANEIGELRKQLRQLQEQSSEKETQQAVNVREAKLAAMRERWGDALVNDLTELLSVELAPVKTQLTHSALRERYPDIDNVKGEMEKIFKQSPALQQAAQADAAVLDTVYAAARAKVGSESGQKAEARKKMVAKQKAEGHVEKPTQKATPKPKVEEGSKEWANGFVDNLISLPPNA